MKDGLFNALQICDEVDFRELDHSIQIAKFAKNIVKDFQIPLAEFAEKLSVSLSNLEGIMGGYYPYDIRLLSKLEAYQSELQTKHTEETAKKLVKFPPYKDSLPIEYMAALAKELKKELTTE